MQVFLTRAYDKLKKDAGRNKQTLSLRDSCDAAADALTAGKGGGSLERADGYLDPLRLACLTRQPKLMVTALDCYQKLIAHGFLRGVARITPSSGPTETSTSDDAKDEGALDEGNNNDEVTVLDRVVDTICKCKDIPAEDVQLQVIKALLTLTTTSSVELHDTALLTAVQACYHIHLTSRNAVNKSTAKSTLSQMISTVFQRMEAFDLRPPLGENLDQEDSRTQSKSNGEEARSDNLRSSEEEEEEEDEEEEAQAREAEEEAPLEVDINDVVVEDSAANTATSDEGLVEGDAGAATEAEASPADEENSATANPQGGTEDESSSASDAADVDDTAPAVAAESVPAPEASAEPSTFDSILHKDAFLLFRALCKLSMRSEGQSSSSSTAGSNSSASNDLSGGADGASGVALQSKLVALTSLLSILEHCGPSFRSSDKFVYAIRSYLCLSLLKNCTSVIPAVVNLSLQIFVRLIANFKDHLKAEIEVFICNVFLRLLDSENSTAEHKTLVLEVFHAICQDPQALVEIFLNYDCNLDNVDLFRRIVTSLAKVAKGGAGGGLSAGVIVGDGLTPNPTSAATGDGAAMAKHLNSSSDDHENGGANDDGSGSSSGSSSGNNSSSSSSSGISNNGAPLVAGAEQLKALVALVATTHSLALSSRRLVALSEKSANGPMKGPRPMGKRVHHGPNNNLREAREAREREEVLAAANAREEEEMRQSTAAAAGTSAEQGTATSDNADEGSASGAMVAFASKKKIQEALTNGTFKFNQNPKAGLQYFAAAGLLKEPLEPADVAKFLHLHQDRLDKTAVGELLGREKDWQNGLAVQVLHAYTFELDFASKPLDEAIRYFLAGFRLPGEAQKIDRMMEKFAERFCLQNPEVFPSADTAFVLAFSIIMLNTDLHNPAIADDRRMTKAIFRRQVEGIANGGNLPDEYLDAIYDRIKKKPISLKDDANGISGDKSGGGIALLGGVGGGSGGGGLGDLFSSAHAIQGRRRQAAYSREREDMVRESELMFNQLKQQKRIEYIAVEDASDAHVRPMFEVAWGPMLGVYSALLDRVDDPSMVALSLEGLREAVRIAAVLGMSTVRDTLVHTLAKFTTLDTVREMQPKHLECIKVLVGLALTEGDYLAESWATVLEVASQLQRLQLVSAGLTDDGFFHNGSRDPLGGSNHSSNSSHHNCSSGHGSSSSNSSASNSGLHKFFYGPSKAEVARAIEETNAAQVAAVVDSELLDRVFSSSPRLSSSAVEAFVAALCAVSLKELRIEGHLDHHDHREGAQTSSSSAATPSAAVDGSTAGGGSLRVLAMKGFPSFRSRDTGADLAQPRVFSLQKLVEVADGNMPVRGRLVWASVWRLLAEHFTFVACGTSRSGSSSPQQRGGGSGDNNPNPNPNPAVAMFAVDSLRQLSLKFLSKDEMAGFNFQRLFLEPFQHIMAKNQCTEVRELVLSSVNNLLLAKAPMVKSGWRPLLAVFAIAAALENEEALSQQAYNCVHRLVQSHFVLLVHDFRHLVACLLAFVRGPYTEVALGALNLLHHCAANLAKEGFVPELSSSANPGSSQGTPSDSSSNSLLPPMSPSSLMVRSDSAASATSSLSTIVDATSPLVQQGERGTGQGRSEGGGKSEKKGRRFSVSPPPWARRAIKADLKRLRRMRRQQRLQANAGLFQLSSSSSPGADGDKERGDDEEENEEELVDEEEENGGDGGTEDAVEETENEEDKEEVDKGAGSMDGEVEEETKDTERDKNSDSDDSDDDDDESEVSDDAPFDWGGNAWPSASEQAACPHLALWWSILVGLAHQIVDERLTVRSTALAQFEDILHHFGRRFPTPVWRRLLAGVVFPLLVNAIDNDPTQQPISAYPSAYTTSLSAALGAQSRPPSTSGNSNSRGGNSSSGGGSAAAAARGNTSPAKRHHQHPLHQRQSVDSWIATSLRPALAAVVRLFAEHLEWQSMDCTQLGVVSSSNLSAPPPTTEGEGARSDILPIVEEKVKGEDDESSAQPGLHTLLPLLVGFLESITTNAHSPDGCPPGAELLARIGVSTLAELLEALSGCPLPRDAYLGDGPSEEVWEPVAGTLVRLALFASSTSFEKTSAAREGSKTSNRNSSPFSERLAGVDVQEPGGLSDDDGDSTSSSLSGEEEEDNEGSKGSSLNSETFEQDEDVNGEEENSVSSATAADDVDVDGDDADEGKSTSSSSPSSLAAASAAAAASSSTIVAPAKPNAARRTKARVKAATRRASHEGGKGQGSEGAGKGGGKGKGSEPEGSLKERASQMLASLPSPRSPRSTRSPLALPAKSAAAPTASTTKSGARDAGVQSVDSTEFTPRADALPMVEVSGAMTKMVLALKVIQLIRALLDLEGRPGVGAGRQQPRKSALAPSSSTTSPSSPSSHGESKTGSVHSEGGTNGNVSSSGSGTSGSTTSSSSSSRKGHLSEVSLQALLQALAELASAARTLNTNRPLRVALWRCGFMELPPTKLVDAQGVAGPPLRLLPHALDQEVAASRALLGVLFRMLTGNDAEAPTSAIGVPTGHNKLSSIDRSEKSSRNDENCDGDNANISSNGGKDGDDNTDGGDNTENPSLQGVWAEWEMESADALMVTTCQEVLRRYLSVEKALEAALHSITRTNGNAASGPGLSHQQQQQQLPSAERTADEVRGLDYEARCLVPAVTHALRGLSLLSSAKFAEHATWIYPALCDLVSSSSRAVRLLVQQVLAGPVRALVQI